MRWFCKGMTDEVIPCSGAAHAPDPDLHGQAQPCRSRTAGGVRGAATTPVSCCLRRADWRIPEGWEKPESLQAEQESDRTSWRRGLLPIRLAVAALLPVHPGSGMQGILPSSEGRSDAWVSTVHKHEPRHPVVLHDPTAPHIPREAADTLHQGDWPFPIHRGD